MYLNRITKLGSLHRFVSPQLTMAHTPTCPTKKGPKGGSSASPDTAKSTLKRAVEPGKVRMGFIPEEWFLFFHSKTGVSGPYLFGLVLANYMFSKEIYIMEHEYYTGLSIGPMCYLITTKFGKDVGKSLDKEVDAILIDWEKGRKDEISMYEKVIKDSKDAQMRAQAQKLLMDAKKENVAMQLEAIYRERMMQVYRTVRGRLDYQVKLYRASSRIQQKWMVDWILGNVMKALTPEFEKMALERAIQEFSVLSARTK